MNTKDISVFITFGIAVSLVLTSCDRASSHGRIVEFTCDDKIELLNYNDHRVSKASEDLKLAVYLTGPTLFCVVPPKEEGCYYLYFPEDGYRVHLRFDGEILYANGIARGVALDAANASNFVEWCESADVTALQSLRVISYDGGALDACREQLSRIQSANPHLSYMPSEQNDHHSSKTPGHKPWLYFFAASGEDKNPPTHLIERSDFAAVRIVIAADCDDDDILWKLSAKDMPTLHHLFGLPNMGMEAFNKAKVITTEVIEGLVLEKLEHLEELHTMVTEESDAIDFSRLPNPAALRALTLNISTNTAGLERLTNLEYLNPGEIQYTDEELNDLVQLFPNLIYLNLSKASVASLEPLRHLTRLEILVLNDVDADIESTLEVLNDLKRLRYIGMEEGITPEEAAAIRKACPQAVLFRQTCLGSGWLLAALPVAIGMFILKRKRSKAGQGA